MIDNGIDLSIRTREFEPDSNITIRRLAQTRRVLVASPRYLDQAGVPRTVEDLPAHRMLIYMHANTPNQLNFTRGDDTRSILVKGALEANDGQIIRAAALDGLGILVQPKYVIYDDIVAGRLIPVLDDWHLPQLWINIAFQNRQYMAARSRLFIEFLAEHFRKMDYARKWTT
jgi:DNA-binding transcriptional LysR family regulator